uniref:Immunoglobulin V-set domain-containing protein n=1 Tax=Monopterus albus TaxID=43700 RepID=A0A3Q3JQN0_MONAL
MEIQQLTTAGMHITGVQWIFRQVRMCLNAFIKLSCLFTVHFSVLSLSSCCHSAHVKQTALPTGVLQVTWQRLFKDQSIENMATYSERFGQQINGPFLGKVIFTEASLNSTAITLKNVTWEDESCYICSFNVYPDGSKRKQACLTVGTFHLVPPTQKNNRPLQ